MAKKLVQYGDSVALVIDRPIMEMLKLTDETAFELSTDGKNLILSPQSAGGQDGGIECSLEKINRKHGTVLRRLGE
jgi:antitoxin component of MazEF toxin-antitoxin module